MTCVVAPALARKATRGEAAAVAFVVDDLLGWLIGRLADAGYRKLTTLVLGSPEERALKEAVTAAVEATVGEIDPSDGEEAERVAERINKAFHRRDPVPRPPVDSTAGPDTRGSGARWRGR